MPAYLRPTAPIARNALLPGDPKLAMDLAAALMAKPLVSNLSRGLWGYHGDTDTGLELTVQATGIGGPSAAVVLAELAQLGVRRAIRIGACTALDPGLAPGDAIVVESVLAGDGVGSALASPGSARPDGELTAALEAAATPCRVGPVASTDLYYDPDPSRRRDWRDAGALAVELSAAALLSVGHHGDVAVACALAVAESAAGERLDDAALESALLALGGHAAEALAAVPQSAVAEGVPLP